jgi:hypothetical protein
MEGYRKRLAKSLRRKPFSYYFGALTLSGTARGASTTK